MSRDAGIPKPRRLRMALSVGTAAGAAVIAMSLNIGAAPVAGADVLGADPVIDTIGALDAEALSAADVPDTDAASYLIESFDPDAFNSAGAPTDALGLLGYGLDTYLLGPTGLEPVLAPLVDELVGTVTVGTSPTYTDAVSELIAAFDPNAFSATGAPTDALGLLGYGLDTYLLGPTGIDNLLAPLVADYLASSGSSAASVLDAVPAGDVIGALDPIFDGVLNSGLSVF